MLPRSIYAVILAITACIAVLFTRCGIKAAEYGKREKYDPDKADSIAVGYADEKYGEKFVSVGHHQRTDSIIGGNNWDVVDVVKEAEKDLPDPRRYEICISRTVDYTILGDDIMAEYYQKLYRDYAEPLIAQAMGDIPFVLIVSPDLHYGNYGIAPEAEIPLGFDDEKCIYTKKDFHFTAAVPSAYDTEEYDLKTKSKNIKEALTDENYYGILTRIAVVSSGEYRDIVFADDPYWEYRNGSHSHKTYDII